MKKTTRGVEERGSRTRKRHIPNRGAHIPSVILAHRPRAGRGVKVGLEQSQGCERSNLIAEHQLSVSRATQGNVAGS
jgi:hypothetical protein